MARILQRGHTGADVRRLQELLARAGFDPGAVDGIFGPATDGAVRRFQQSRGLAVDGLAGPDTMRALGEGPGPPGGQRQGRSLHIGLNVVDPNAYPMAVPELSGCENDARDMHRLAQSQGFAGTTLLSPAATSRAVVDGISNAAASLRSGDFFFLTYSGHGAQMDDPTGEEPDWLDETWVLYDRQLLDDELRALWTQFQPGVRIFVLSDSCHSGTVVRTVDLAYRAFAAVTDEGPQGFRERALIPVSGTRDIGALGELRRSIERYVPDVVSSFDDSWSSDSPDVDVDYWTNHLTEAIWHTLQTRIGDLTRLDMSKSPRTRNLPPEVQQADARVRHDLYRAAKRRARQVTVRDLTASVLLISGCQDNQLSLDGARNGLFTQRFLEVWQTGAAVDYADLHGRIVRLMPPQQTPNLDWGSARDVAFEAEQPLSINATRRLSKPFAKRGVARGMTT
jgi:hypothetical protein